MLWILDCFWPNYYKLSRHEMRINIFGCHFSLEMAIFSLKSAFCQLICKWLYFPTGTIHMTMGDPNITRQKGRLFCIKQNLFNPDSVPLAKQVLDGRFKIFCTSWALNPRYCPYHVTSSYVPKSYYVFSSVLFQ